MICQYMRLQSINEHFVNSSNLKGFIHAGGNITIKGRNNTSSGVVIPLDFIFQGMMISEKTITFSDLDTISLVYDPTQSKIITEGIVKLINTDIETTDVLTPVIFNQF